MAIQASYNDLLNDAADKEHAGYVWYETFFSVPVGWDGKRIVLRFGSATHHVICWFNGQKIVRHEGGFLADITELVENSADKKSFRLTAALSNILDWTCLPCGEIVTKSGPGYPEGYSFAAL